MQEHIATVFLFHSHIHVWVREERAGSPPSCHRVLAHVDPQIIARGEEGSVRSLNMGLGVWVQRARTRIRVYTCVHPYPAYMYMSLCYITMQSQTYVILNLHIYTLTYAPKISLPCHATDATFLAHTPWVVGEYVQAHLCQPHSRTDTHTYGGGSLHMCSLNSLGSMPHRLRRISL